jgi:hypothetical protein
MRWPRVVNPYSNFNHNRVFDILMEDTIAHRETGNPWAAEFVCEHVNRIIYKPMDCYGWSRGGGVIWIDPCMDDNDHTYARIASVVLHEAYHEFINEPQSTEQELRCCREQAEFLDRIGYTSAARWAWGKYYNRKARLAA